MTDDTTDFHRVDALFAPRDGPGLHRSFEKQRTVRRLLYSAIALTLFGFVSCTGVPGALMALWAWQIVEREWERLQAQPEDAPADPRWERTRSNARSVLWSCVVSLLLQTVLLALGFYEALGRGVIEYFGL